MPSHSSRPRGPSHSLLACALALSLAGCAASATESSSGSAAAPPADPSGGSDTSGGSTPAALPPSYNPGQGETAYGVYLAFIGDGDQAEVGRLLTELEARGVTGGGSGQLSCDQGAAAALGADEDQVAVSVGFRTRAEAEQFVEAWGAPVVGIAEFVAYCRD